MYVCGAPILTRVACTRFANMETVYYTDWYSSYRTGENASKQNGLKTNNNDVLETMKKHNLPELDDEHINCANIILTLLELREKWVMKYPIVNSPAVKNVPPSKDNPNPEPLYDPLSVNIPAYLPGVIQYENGVFCFIELSRPSKIAISESEKFINDLAYVKSVLRNSKVSLFAFRRLELLEQKFKLHNTLYFKDELKEVKLIKSKDFNSVIKVDTHIHLSGAVRHTQLLEFIKKKYRTEPDAVILKQDGRDITLKEFIDENIKCTPDEMTLDMLDTIGTANCFKRFDLFNEKYSPFGYSELRTTFLKSDNCLEGRFLGELVQEMIQGLEKNKYQYVEWRKSIYGISEDEWYKLARWVLDNKLLSKNVRWIIQIPRLYANHKAKKHIKSFGEMLNNIFKPLFHAVQDPQNNKEIYYFLNQVVAWDCVDDETNPNANFKGSVLPTPDEWTFNYSPPFSYFHYYIYANIKTLNELLIKQNIEPKLFRPHCGESGNVNHLASMYLLANGINHGILLRKSPTLMYLYYLKQIGIAAAPIGNHAVYLDYTKLPFYRYYSIGMNVSLSSDDPLVFHFSTDPLLEEYSTFAIMFRLSPVDLCELARSSVIQSGYEHQMKAYWLGPNYYRNDIGSNSPNHTNTSNIRFKFRLENWLGEMQMLKYLHAGGKNVN